MFVRSAWTIGGVAVREGIAGKIRGGKRRMLFVGRFVSWWLSMIGRDVDWWPLDMWGVKKSAQGICLSVGVDCLVDGWPV